MNELLPIIAQAGKGAPTEQSPMHFVGMIVIMIAIMYFILIRPQQRKDKERRALLSAVKSGDRVLFGGGIIGTVTNVKDKIITIKIAEKVKVEVARAAVSQILPKGEDPSEDALGK